MKGNEKVIKALNEMLASELTAINQYFIHAEMCENWGYSNLAKVTKMESIDEMRHAERLMERILFLDGTPNMSKYFKINVGSTVQEQFKVDLALELDAVERYNKGIALATAEKDSGSRELMKELLVDEEKHVDFLEAQLEQIKQMGIQNYLAIQAQGGGAAGGE